MLLHGGLLPWSPLELQVALKMLCSVSVLPKVEIKTRFVSAQPCWQSFDTTATGRVPWSTSAAASFPCCPTWCRHRAWFWAAPSRSRAATSPWPPSTASTSARATGRCSISSTRTSSSPRRPRRWRMKVRHSLFLERTVWYALSEVFLLVTGPG